MLLFSWEDVGKGTNRFAHHAAISGETNAAFLVPSGGRITNLYVTCSAAITSGSHTITLRKNGTNTTLACVLTGGATTCADTVDTVDFLADDELNLRITNAASTQAPSCRAMATLTAAGSSLPHDNVLTWHTASEQPTTGSYCGLNVVPGTTAATCYSGSADDVSVVMPSGGILTGIAVRLTSGTGSGRTETFTVRNLTTGTDTGLMVTILTGDATGIATCASNCSYAAGDRLAVRFNRTGAPIARGRAITVAYTSPASLLMSRTAHFASATRYTGYHLNMDATVPGSAAVRIDRPARLRNVVLHSTTAVAVATTVTVCSGPTSPPSCSGTRPQCAIAVGGTACSDLVNSTTVSAGDYVEVQIGHQGNTAGTIGFAVEIVDP